MFSMYLDVFRGSTSFVNIELAFKKYIKRRFASLPEDRQTGSMK